MGASLLRRVAVSGSDGRFEWSSSSVGELKLSFNWRKVWTRRFREREIRAGLSRPVEKPRKRFSAERAVRVESPKGQLFVLNKPIRIQGTAVNGLTGETFAEFEARVLYYSSDDEELSRVQDSNGTFVARVSSF